jgi:DNA-binding response OmpR family regulator
MPASSASSVVRFGSFEFDVLSGELRRSGMRVNLQDQPLRVLECLLERPGQPGQPRRSSTAPLVRRHVRRLRAGPERGGQAAA